MSKMDLFMHGLGVLSLAIIAVAGGLSVSVIIDEIVPNWRRIIAILFPVTNAASADPALGVTDPQEHVHG